MVAYREDGKSVLRILGKLKYYQSYQLSSFLSVREQEGIVQNDHKVGLMTSLTDEISDYVARYSDLFARADQREWFRLYVNGLLTAPDRKNVEAIAALATPARSGANLSQALQHFVTDSPWDPSGVQTRYRDLLPTSYGDEGTAWVVHDGVLLKKGKNSVGTQRQFARSIGRKVNCQIAVVVGIVGQAGYVPLAARLYLPGYWLREQPELTVKTVPSEHRTHVSKSAIALSLLDELRAEGWAASKVAMDDGYRNAEGFGEALETRDIQFADEAREHLTVAAQRFEWLKTRLGLDHFEGRTWIGWHHHMAMVLAATGFLLSEQSDGNAE
ncbi:MAG: transposase [Planctomycetaceae bacterium]|nr:transposase [Planctomycetaceae bacterium]